MSFDYFKDDERSRSGNCGEFAGNDNCQGYNREGGDDCEQSGRSCKEKEFLGKSVSECKYFRVCEKRFYKAEKPCNNERHDCGCCRCECCK